jgi:signal transduction histidine kinase
VLGFLSIRWRLTLFHAVIILAIGGLLVGYTLWVAYRGVSTSVEESVEHRASEITRLLEAGAAPDDPAIAANVDDGFLLVVRDAEGSVLAEIDNDPFRYDRLGDDERASLSREVLATGAVADDTPLELYGYGVPVTGPGEARVVEVWRSYDEAANEILPILEVVTFAIPGLVIVAIAASWFMAKSAMAPVNDIVQKARRISEHDLSERLPVARPRDELGQLATTFNALLARLDVAFRQREESLARQRQFVADASHELRTPLTSIEGYARMLRQWGVEDPGTARESAEVIEREAGRMRQLVEGMLNLAHGDVGIELALEAHDLRAIVNDAVAAARMTAAGRVGVFARVPEAPTMATVDRDRIYQVLGILLDNAVKYTPEGGSVSVGVVSRGETVELAVRDTGMGIDARHLPHVFDRFYRVDEARAAGGSGLGLAIAKQLVEEHGGEIAVESAVGAGTVVTITLPASGPDRSFIPANDDPPGHLSPGGS